MRLLHSDTYKLEEFGSHNIPLYAILSYRWGKDEIAYQDVGNIHHGDGAGHDKVRKFCGMAKAHGFEYVWIDTCCIDKTSSAELSEAINSMYRWYQEAAVCYAYLADVPTDTFDRDTRAIGPEFSESKWFTRGWTLQELIAPSMVIFLDQAWQEIGTKSNLRSIISKITGIPDTILERADLDSASVAQRMSWASKRETTRVEDLAYCLMGIFGVNMPMLYGEGVRAFIRLQEEIMRSSDDHSLFAWESSDSSGGLLASSPAAFSKSSKIVPVDLSGTLSGAITINNKGIHLKLGFMDIERTSSQRVELAILPCEMEGGAGEKVGIYVRAMSETKEYFERIRSSRLERINFNGFNQPHYTEKSLCVRQGRRTQKNQSPLAKAAEKAHEAVVRLLLEKGVDPDSRGGDGLDPTPLSQAAMKGHQAVVRLLLEKGADPNLSGADGWIPLSRAAQNGHDEVARLLLENGVDPNCQTLMGWTPLAQAAENGHGIVVRLLLDRGADPNSQDPAPLSRAAMKGHEAVVNLLLETGVDPNSEDGGGWTPMALASGEGHEAVVRLLLEKGADPNLGGVCGWIPLSQAVQNGHEAVVRLLCENGANPDLMDGEGCTPLGQAAQRGHKAVMRLLLEKSTDIDPKDDEGCTPLARAARNGHEAVMEQLLEKGANPNTTDRSGWTPLFHAAQNGYEAAVRLLLEKGADPSSGGGDGCDSTLLSQATKQGHGPVAMLLLETSAEKSR
ncbi:HET domain-containing protein [Fusarium sp. LHS14.1]|nr:HET domain-containing protein [Fusarium sp. LHS14.1]